MRKRRALIFDDEVAILMLLQRFLEDRGYETLVFEEPSVCPVYGQDVKSCGNLHPCADIMITDLKMPRMTGVEMLRLQAERNCRIDIRNKAVISGMLDAKEEEEVARLGCSFFKKPFRFFEIIPWLDACETRIDLDRPLGMKRQGGRVPCFKVVTCRTDRNDRDSKAFVINMSPSGICLKVNIPLSRDQIVYLGLDVPPPRRKASVRWSREIGDGFYEAGLVYC